RVSPERQGLAEPAGATRLIRGPTMGGRSSDGAAPFVCTLMQVTAEQGEQALPVAFGVGLAVGRALREGEAVVGALVELDLGVDAIALQRGLERLQLGKRRIVVKFGPGHIDLALGLAGGDVR